MADIIKIKKCPKYHDYSKYSNECIPKKVYQFKSHPSREEIKLIPEEYIEYLKSSEEGNKFYETMFNRNDKWKYEIYPQKVINKLLSGLYDDDSYIKLNDEEENINYKDFKMKRKKINYTDDSGDVNKINDDNIETLDIQKEKELIYKYVGYLHPSAGTHSFSTKINKHKEFNETKYDGTLHEVKEESDKLCMSEFELMPHQNFVKNFLSLDTPYKSLLLYHGLGTGKTCSAIGVAEEYRKKIMNTNLRHNKNTNKKIIVVAFPDVINNFRTQLFDESKLKFQNGVWTINSCVGESLLREINPTNLQHLNRSDIVDNINQVIKRSYTFRGYTAFSKEWSNKFYTSNDNDEKRLQAKVKKYFNDTLIIVDEVHNIRKTNENDRTKTAELLMTIAKYSENMLLLLLSATPMFNSHEEIIWLTNLLNMNDGKEKLKISDIFKNGHFKSIESKDLLKQRIMGYVSYVRGENPYTFPYRIYAKNSDYIEGYKWSLPKMQMNGKLITKNEEMNTIKEKMFMNTISDFQHSAYVSCMSKISKEVKSLGTNYNIEKESFLSELNSSIEALNFVYPKSTVDDGANNYILGKVGLYETMNYKTMKTELPYKYDFEYNESIKEQYGKIFSQEHLHKYSGKLSSISNIIKNANGIIIIYTRLIDSGAVPIALVLEEMGFRKYSKIQNTRTLLKDPPEEIDSLTMTSRSEMGDTTNFSAAKYIMITGDKEYSPNNKEDVQELNKVENANGKNIKVVIISRAGGEGIDYKNIRQIHVLDPWFNLNRIEQIIGRGVRNLSHCALPFEDRNVEIFLHATQLKDDNEAADLYLYRYAEKKSIRIGKITRMLKENSVDCILNIGQTNFTELKMKELEKSTIEIRMPSGKLRKISLGDKPFTDICDYMNECNYKCNIPESYEDEELYTTYEKEHMVLNQDAIIKRVKYLFRDQKNGVFYMNREDLIKSINAVKSYPIEQINSTLNKLTTNYHEYLIDRYGRIGHLHNKGKYYYFLPREITDDHASIYEISNPIDLKTKSIAINTIKKVKVERGLQDLLKIIVSEYNKAIYNISESNSVWINNFAFVYEHLLNIHLVPQEVLKLLVVSRILETFGKNENILLLNYVYSQEYENSEVNKYLKQHYDERIIISDDYIPIIGIPLTISSKEVGIFGGNDWEELEYVDKERLINSKTFFEKYKINSNSMNELFGFTDLNSSSCCIFKMRNLDVKRNTIGADIKQADNKDILIKLNKISGKSMYSKKPSGGHDFLCSADKLIYKRIELIIIIEVLIRYYEYIKKDNRNWYLFHEKYILNDI